VSFVEVMLFLLLFQDFRRQSTDVRTAVAFFVVGWATGASIWGVLLRRYTTAVVLQLSLSCATLAMIGGLTLRDLSRADWFPDEVLGRNLIVMSIYAIGAIAGMGASGRRMTALSIAAIRPGPTISTAAIAVVGGGAPLLIARLSMETTIEKALAGGIVLTLLVLILVGAASHGGPVRRLALPGRPRESALIRR
jgi:hypothetical protein